MEPGLTRKLAIAAGAVAAFFGFVALTAWTSSGELSERDKRELGIFCSAMAQSSGYESALRTALVSGGQDVFGGGGVVDNGISSFIENTLLESAPERYRDDAAHLVEGLEQGLQGQLTPEQVDGYIDDYHRLEDRSSGDCEQFDDEPPDFGGGGDGGPFGFGGSGGD